MNTEHIATNFNNPETALLVYVSKEEYMEEGLALSQKLDARLITQITDEDAEKLMIRFDEDGVSLAQGKLSMRGDFTSMMKRLKSNNLHQEMLVKASKLKGFEGTPLAIDATAGMGEDSLLLATAGFEVYLYEFDPVIAALLKDTIRRAGEDPILGKIVARMHVVEGNSVEDMRKLGEMFSKGSEPAAEDASMISTEDAPMITRQPDLIYLDPMFPARQKSGLIKKKFQLLQQLERPCSDDAGDEMLRAAMSVRPRKLVIKRPLKGPYLADLKPEYSLTGKAIRYDCFTFAR